MATAANEMPPVMVRPPRAPKEMQAIQGMLKEPAGTLTGFGEWIQAVEVQYKAFDAGGFQRELLSDVIKIRQGVVLAMGMSDKLEASASDSAFLVGVVDHPDGFNEKAARSAGLDLTPAEIANLKEVIKQVKDFAQYANIGEIGTLAKRAKKGAVAALAVDTVSFGLAFSRKTAEWQKIINQSRPTKVDLGMRDYLDRILNSETSQPDYGSLGVAYKGQPAQIEASANYLHSGSLARAWLNQRMMDVLESAILPELPDAKRPSGKPIDSVFPSTIDTFLKQLKVESLAGIKMNDDRTELLTDRRYSDLVDELAKMLKSSEQTAAFPVESEKPDNLQEALNIEFQRLKDAGIIDDKRLEELRRETADIETRKTARGLAMDKLLQATNKIEALQTTQRSQEVVATRKQGVFTAVVGGPIDAEKIKPDDLVPLTLDPATFHDTESVIRLMERWEYLEKLYPGLPQERMDKLHAALAGLVSAVHEKLMSFEDVQDAIKGGIRQIRELIGEEKLKEGEQFLSDLSKPPADLTTQEAEINAILSQVREVK